MRMTLSGQGVILPENSKVVYPLPEHKNLPFSEAAERAMDAPLNLPPLANWDLASKKICILVDDWGRPTPAGAFLPAVLDRLNKAGAADKDITIVTASGMHDVMNEKDMARKVGGEAYARCVCVSHDAGNADMLSFVGISPLGSPIWVNRFVAEADFKMALGRIYPHSVYGFEGGYKMIVPGAASFETIMRDHSLNFSPHSDYGSLQNNPSRKEADAIGRIVGIDFLVNFVINWDQQPVAAFAGTPEAVFPAGIRKGQRDVWSVPVGEKHDITILCANKAEDLSLSNNPTYYLGLALSVTKESGAIIAAMDYVPREKTIVEGHDLDNISFDALIKLHEKRNWNLNDRQIQHVIKSIRGAYYFRRVFEMRPQSLYLVSKSYPAARLKKWKAQSFANLQEAYDTAAEHLGLSNPKVLVIPDGTRAFPVVSFDFDT